jgi:hypothetical protein
MTEQQRLASLQTKKLQLSLWDKVTHFAIIGVLLGIPLMVILFHLKELVNGKPASINQEGEIYFIMGSIILAIFFYKLQSDRLKFKEVHTTMSRQKLNDIIEKVGKELKWYPEEISEHIFIAKTHPSFFSGSWGEQITIVFDTNKVLVNSICDPDQKSSVVSMGRNKKNVRRLIEEIDRANQ